MFDLFSRFKKNQIWDFNGGIHPPEMKAQTSHIPLKRAALPSYLQIPLQQHLGPEGELLVKTGDRVLKGQPLTTGKNRMLPVHASTSGTISAIDYYPSTHPSALPERCVRLEPDGLEQWCQREMLIDYRTYSAEQLIEHIHQAGIAGLGGAVFPTASKINGALSRVKTLIINGAECEPYITADDLLMQEYADELLIGCEILNHILQPETIIIGIEDNKPDAVKAIKQSLHCHEKSNIIVRVIPTKYPSGGAKQLTKILTGLEVPHGGRSSDIGVLMQNVGTVFAIKRAVINGEPLLERIVTLTGNAIENLGNVWALLGTPVSELLHQFGYQQQQQPMVIMGGPLMGFALSDLSVPVTKMSNCIIAPGNDEIAQPEAEQACIRCTQCADACPAGLLPQQLYWFSRGKEHDKARNYNLFDCIECGACAYVCPSNIPLVQYYRQEKAEIREQDEQAELARVAKIRFEAKQARLEREKAARLQRHKKAETQVTPEDNLAIQSALERVKRQKSSDVTESGHPVINSINGSALPDNSAAIAARRARKAQRQATLENQSIAPSSDTSAIEEIDPRKAALAAAIARAKAKKAQQQSATTLTETHNDDICVQQEDIDPRKAAVAEAIARAKAKRELQTKQQDNLVPPAIESVTDDRKTAVAAAIARVKAKKELQKMPDQADLSVPDPNDSSPNEQSSDNRKAAVAEAIARVKARKAMQQNQPQPNAAQIASVDVIARPDKALHSQLTSPGEE